MTKANRHDGGMRRAILVFVKYPEPGRVKTRLAATVGPENAASIYQILAETVLRGMPEGFETWVFFDPAEREAEVRRWLVPVAGAGTRFCPQAEGDLGHRLSLAFDGVFEDGVGVAMVVGSDCVEITPEDFAATERMLEVGDCVIGPSDDGGYYLMALKRQAPELFVGVPWSAPDTLAKTLERAAQAGLRVELLPVRHDVDTEQDWRRAQSVLNFSGIIS